MYRNESPRESTLNYPSDDVWVCSDPWEANEADQPIETDNWLLGYVDMLTLMLTLVVMLLALNQIENRRPGSARTENALEFTKDTNNDQDAKSDRSADSLPVNQSIGVPATINHPLSIAPIVQQTVPTNPEDEILMLFSIQSGSTDDLPDHNIRNKLLNDMLDDLDLSIDPFGPLDHHFPASTEALTSVLSEKPSATDAEKKNDDGITETNEVENFQRIVSEHNLDGLIDVLQSHNAVRMEVNERILFEIADAELKPDGKTLLTELAILLRDQPGNIHIEGHTDNVPIATPRFPSNWELSTSRASSVARYLIDQSVDPGRLRAIGFADTKPRAGNQTPEGRSKNRRVSLVIEMDDSQTP